VAPPEEVIAETTKGSAPAEGPPAERVNGRESLSWSSVPAGRLLLLLVVLGVVGLLAIFGLAVLRRQGGASFAGFGINAAGRAADLKARQAPDFEIESFTVGTIRLYDLRGRVVLLNFWASWCAPCREEARTLATAAEAYAGRGVTFVGINEWDSDNDARAFLERYDVRYPNGPDRGGRVAIEYGLTGIPETFVVNRAGMLGKRWVGPFTPAQLERFVEELLQ
jgi:cytochrome c biogenesis protein CcmG/thiol:disulfide interchange protein DsbE